MKRRQNFPKPHPHETLGDYQKRTAPEKLACPWCAEQGEGVPLEEVRQHIIDEHVGEDRG